MPAQKKKPAKARSRKAPSRAAAPKKAPERRPPVPKRPQPPRAPPPVARTAAAPPRREIQAAEHEHVDPRGVGDHGQVHSGGYDARPVNWGQQKAKSVSRLDKVSNWFRRGRGR